MRASLTPAQRAALDAYRREQLRLGRAPTTISSHRTRLTRFLRFLGKAPTRITTADLRAYLAQRQREGLAATTQQAELRLLRGFFRTLVRLERVKRDPAEGLSVVAGEPGPRVELGERSIRALFMAAHQRVNDVPARRANSRALALRDLAALELLFALGLRASEVTATRVLDLNLVEGTQVVRRAKRGLPGTLPLPPRSLPALRRYLAEGRPVLAANGRGAGFLLLSWRGRPLGTSALRELVNRLAVQAGLRAHPHAFRHAVATALLRNGACPTDVQALLGHADLSTTAVYLRVGAEELRATVELLERG